MLRRKFVFWLGLGLFNLAEQLRVSALDDLAATLTRKAGDSKNAASPEAKEHWSVASNRTWWWYERENWSKGQWTLTGITTPIHKKNGQPFVGRNGYLDESLVPRHLRVSGVNKQPELAEDDSPEFEPGQPDPARRARHGRPPSKWLRSLHAEELRIWLKTIDVPEAGVSGMTFWTHLTEDHSFNPENIEGLNEEEQAKLHAAAHFGY